MNSSALCAVIVVFLLIIIAIYGETIVPLIAAVPVVLIGAKLKEQFDESTYMPIQLANTVGKDIMSGIVSLCVMKSNDYNKRVILLGDRHNFENLSCDETRAIYAPEYVQWLLKNNQNIYFDLFHEFDYNEYSKKLAYDPTPAIGRSGIFANYHKIFGECIDDLGDRAACLDKYPNSRFHLTDTRLNYKLGIKSDYNELLMLYYVMRLNYGSLSYDINKFEKRVKSGAKNKDEYIDKYKKIYVKYLQPYKIIKSNKLYSIVVGLLSTNTTEVYMNIELLFEYLIGANDEQPNKVKKNYQMLTKDMQNKILDFLLVVIKADVDKFNREFIMQFFDMVGKENIDSYEEFVNISNTFRYFMAFIGHFIVYSMDIYTISRMFRKFDKTKSGDIELHPSADNVVILAGDAHIQTYIAFMRDLGFQTVFETKNEDKCLDISKMPNRLDDIKLL